MTDSQVRLIDLSSPEGRQSMAGMLNREQLASDSVPAGRTTSAAASAASVPTTTAPTATSTVTVAPLSSTTATAAVTGCTTSTTTTTSTTAATTTTTTPTPVLTGGAIGGAPDGLVLVHNGQYYEQDSPNDDDTPWDQEVIHE